MKEYKLVMLGSGGVGKSCLTVQFVQSIFLERYDPTIEDSYRKQVEIDGNQCMLEILDTAGAEQFSAMRDMYMKNGQGFVLVYSITNQSSFHDLDDIRDQIIRIKDTEDVPIILVGNKCDLEDQRSVGRLQGQHKAKAWNASFAETSARSNVGVDDVNDVWGAFAPQTIPLEFIANKEAIGSVLVIFGQLIRQIDLKTTTHKKKDKKCRCCVI